MRARLAAYLLFALAAPLLALEIPPKPTAWVTDNAHILSASEQQALNEKLETLKQRAATEFLIMTFPSLEGEDVTAYTNRVADQWKVKNDKALMVFVFLKERKAWIQVGYGLEPVITDAYASRVYRNTLVPYFREQRYFDGLNAAVDELALKIDPNALTGTQHKRETQTPAGGLSANDLLFALLIILFFLLVLSPIVGRGGCRGCFWPMFFWPGGGGGITFGGGGGGGGWNVGGSWGSGSSFGGGGAGGGW